MKLYQMWFGGMDLGHLGNIGGYGASGFGDTKYPEIHKVDAKAMFAEMLEKTPHYFVFIITHQQEEKWDKFVEEYKLHDYVHYKMPYFVTNRNHSDMGRRLKLIVFKGKGTYED